MCCCFFYICCFCCFTKLNTKTLEIILIVFHSIATLFLFCSFFIFKWQSFEGKFLAINLILFILIELISIACLVFSILLLIWRAKNKIKIKKIKDIAITISVIGFTFAILLIALTIIEEFVFLYFLPEDNLTLAFGIIIFSVLELTTFLEIGIWYIEKNRVELGLDIPPPENTGYRATVRQTTSSGRKTMYEPNKRKKNVNKLIYISDDVTFIESPGPEFEVISI